MGVACDLVDVAAAEFAAGAKDLASFAGAMKKKFGRDLPDDVIAAAFKKAVDRYKSGSGEIDAIKLELAKTLAQADRSNWVQVATGLRKAGMLANVRTMARNLTGNTLSIVFDEIASLPGGLVDAAVGMLSGTRTVSIGNWDAARKGIASSVTKGMKEAWSVLKDGAIPSELAKYDFPREMNTGFKPLDAYVNYVMRFQSAMDRPFREYALKKSLVEQAQFIAGKEKLRGAAREKRVRELVAEPTEAMQINAIAISEEAIFANKNRTAEWINQGKAMNDALGFAIDALIPFAKVPTNVAGRALEATPLGAVFHGIRAGRKLISRDFDAVAQRSLSMGLGRSVTGTAVIWAGYKLAEKGLITPDFSSTPGVRDREEASGRSPGSIKIGRTYYRLGDSPPGMLLVVGATIFSSMHEGKKPADAAGASAKAIGKQLLDMPMLKGASDAVDALKSPDKTLGRFAQRYVGSYVPAPVADAAKISDDVERSPEPGNIESTLAERSGIGRDKVPVRHDALGKPVERRSLVNPFQGMDSREDDPVVAELQKHRVSLSKYDRKSELTETEHQRRVKLTGEAVYAKLKTYVDSPIYKKAKPEQQKKMLEKAIRKAKTEISKRFSAEAARKAS